MNRNGFSLVEIVVAIIVVAIIGAAVFLFLNFPANSNEANDSTPRTYQSDKDLESAATELESTNIDAELDVLLQEVDREAAAF